VEVDRLRDESDIRELQTRQQGAWNRHDANTGTFPRLLEIDCIMYRQDLEPDPGPEQH